ncbi:hypothetical protein TNCV_3421531 [Trichonephila clavipes]|nr:hypothetical protein TNCV_3421531 [Trichonephila clavipes]
MHQNLIENDSKKGYLGDNNALLKNSETLKEIKNNLVNNSKPNDKKKPKKHKCKKQDSEGFVFPAKSARPTTPTQVPEPIPTQNNFENLSQEPEPMIESNQENKPP